MKKKPGAGKQARGIVVQGKQAAAAATKRAESLVSLIARRKAHIAEDWYDIALAVHELWKKKLHVALGFKSFEAMLAAKNLVDNETARRLVAVIEAKITREQAVVVGPTMAYWLVRYTRATPAPDAAPGLIADDAPIAGKRVSDATAKHVRRAALAEAQKRRGAAHRSDAEKAAYKDVRRIAKRLHDLGIKRVDLDVSKRNGVWLVSAIFDPRARAQLLGAPGQSELAPVPARAGTKRKPRRR